jgi:hypothetical protein
MAALSLLDLDALRCSYGLSSPSLS